MLLPPIPLANYASLLAAQAVLGQVKPFAPTGFRSGDVTYVEGSAALVLDDNEKWSRVWARHTRTEWIGKSAAPEGDRPPNVDFNRNVVVALFAGPMYGVIGYRPLGGFILGKEATLRLAPVVDPSRSSGVVPMPWAFVILPRTSATVTVEVAGANGWTKVARVKPSL